MVRAAKVKQVAAEKRFKEANNKVGGNITFVYTFKISMLFMHLVYHRMLTTHCSTPIKHLQATLQAIHI